MPGDTVSRVEVSGRLRREYLEKEQVSGRRCRVGNLPTFANAEQALGRMCRVGDPPTFATA